MTIQGSGWVYSFQEWRIKKKTTPIKVIKLIY